MICKENKQFSAYSINFKSKVMDSIGFYMNIKKNSTNKSKRMVLRYKAARIFDLPDASFTKYFRLNKAAFKYVLGQLNRKLPPVARSSSLSPELKLAACLRFLAEGGQQDGVGLDFNLGIAQSTMSVVLSEVLTILEEQLCPKWISLAMLDEEKREARNYFFNKCKIPGVVMCIDGLHIKISKPTGDNSHLFVNRKGFFSLNVMIICDHKQRIRFVDAKYPGSSHDSLVWRNSDAFIYFKSLYDNGDKSSRLLGDAGYPLSPWLITPFKNAAARSPKSRFNTSHRNALNIIEKTFGMWKNWCRCFVDNRQLHYSPRKAVQIINVAAALHNIRIHFKINQEYVSDYPEYTEEDEPEDDINEELIPTEIYLKDANQLRNQFLSNFEYFEQE